MNAVPMDTEPMDTEGQIYIKYFNLGEWWTKYCIKNVLSHRKLRMFLSFL